MWVSTEMTLEKYIETFKNKFTNFCKKAPVKLSFDINPLYCLIKEHYSGEVQKFPVNTEVSVNQFIFNIKNWLMENLYPVMIESRKYEYDYTAQELTELMDNEGLSLEEALTKKKIVEESVVYRIEKLILTKDHLIVRNMKNNNLSLYELKMPSGMFIKNLNDKKRNFPPEKAFIEFKKYSRFIKPVKDITAEEFENHNNNFNR